MSRMPLAPNRPGQSPKLHFRATQEMVDAVDRLGAADGLSRSEVFREAVAFWLALLEARTLQLAVRGTTQDATTESETA